MINRDEGLRLVTERGAADNWLAVLVTLRPDGKPSTSVVNAGVLPHPRTGEPVVAFVSRGATAKLANLRRHAEATLVFRAGWEWVSVSGPVELAGPDDPGLDDIPQLLRDIYHAAGGNHPDLDEYDRAMAEDRRTAVLMTPTKFATNPRGAEHKDSDE
ncbi:TIGR03618 family F420-dependent PPOX class oxidoreductase [Kibdelosporangium lantanae]